MKVYSWLLHVFHNTTPVAPWRGGVGTKNTAGNSRAVLHTKLSQWSAMGNKFGYLYIQEILVTIKSSVSGPLFLRAPLIWLWLNFLLGGIKRMTLGC